MGNSVVRPFKWRPMVVCLATMVAACAANQASFRELQALCDARGGVVEHDGTPRKVAGLFDSTFPQWSDP